MTTRDDATIPKLILEEDKAMAATQAMLGALIRTLVKRGVINPRDLAEDLSLIDVPEHSHIAEGVQFAREIIWKMVEAQPPNAAKK